MIVPSRTWYDPVIGARLSTGQDAIDSIEQYLRECPDTPISFDIETPGLDNAFTINCVTAAWRWPDNQVHTILLDPYRKPADARAARELINSASTICFHNAAFDIPPLYHAGLFNKAAINKVTDTLLLARIGMPDVKISKRLERLAVSILKWTDSAGGMELAFKAAGYSTKDAGYASMDINSPIYRFGAMADTVATLLLESELTDIAVEWLTDHPFQFYGATTRSEALDIIATQLTVHRVMLRRSAVGINVDRNYLNSYAESVAMKRAHAERELALHGLEGGAGKGAALVEYLNTIGELPERWPRTATGKLSSAKDNLDALDHPLATAQRSLAEQDRVLGYLKKVEAQAQVTGRCHPQVGVLGASATGRMSYSSPELQQFSADARPILCDDDGDGLVSIDWSQIEPVTMANMAGDETFLAAFEAGNDLYEPIMRSCGVERSVAKTVLLAAMYGQGIESMAKRINHTNESAAQLRRQMFASMPNCAKWMSGMQSVASQYSRIATAAGRILPVDEGFDYKATNYAIQGSAYDVLAATIVEMERRGIGDELVLAMHDELVVKRHVCDEVRSIMMQPPEFLVRVCGRDPIFRTDLADMGRSWAKV